MRVQFVIPVLTSILILGVITFQDVDAQTFPESFIEVQKLTALDAESGKGFGYQVDIDGNTAVISEVANLAGGVHVFDFDTTTKTWNQVATLTTVPEIDTDNFGRAVAISGDTIIIGAQNDHEAGQFAGAAYVFERDASNSWSQVAKLIASDADHDSHFGGDGSIDIDGNTAMIGAFADDGDCPADDPATAIDEHECNAGATYVFEKNESTGVWEEKQKLTRNLPERGFFGISNSIDGDTVVIGSAFADSLLGGAFVFQRDAATNTWSQQAELSPLDPADKGFFGRIVAHYENTALVFSPSGNSGSGAILVFEKDPATNIWSETQQMIPTDGSFSFSRVGLSITDDTTIISSSLDNAAYVFELDASNIWSETQKIETADNNAGSFGGSLAMSDETIIVGANTSADPTLGEEFVGAAYVFSLGAILSEDMEGDLDVKNGILRIDGATVNGDVKVKDGTLLVDDSTINGDIVIKKNSRVEASNTIIDGDVDAKKCGTLALADNEINGNLDVKDCNDVLIRGNSIDDAKITKNENLKFNVNTISDNLEIKKNQICIASQNNVGGDSKVDGCVENTPPAIDSVELTSSFPSTFTNLSCTVIGANDVDDDPITFSFDWFINGVYVTTADILSSSFTEVDDEIFCEVFPFDGTDSGTPVASNTITIISFGGGGGL